MSQDWANIIPDLAHDVRALVRKGLLNAQLLDRELEPTANEEVKARLGAIIESQAELDHLLRRMVALADAERSHASRERVGLSTAAAAARLASRDALKQAGATVVWREMPTCLVPSSTQTVFRELIDNAIRFRDPARSLHIVVDGQIRNGKLRLSVADNGLGVPAGNSVNLFRPLQRLDARHSGFGLGLAICRAIIEGQDGNIYNLPTDSGAIFVFELAVIHES